MKRIFMFLVVNIAAVATLTIVATIVCGLLGVDIAAELGEGGYAPLLVFSFSPQNLEKAAMRRFWCSRSSSAWRAR